MTLDPPMRQRPTLHFTPPVNWLNDPNGLIEHQGRFHLFYQHNPHAPVWGRPHWGHAVSDDLLHWNHLPIALTPSEWFDEAGCYSGCTVIDDDGTPTILYTGVSPGPDGLVERVIRATGSRDLVTWTKDPEPVIGEPPPGMSLHGFRDPFVWRESDGRWSLILGAGEAGQGLVLLYRSPDLRRWEYLGVLLRQSDVGSDLASGDLWECPQLVRLADRDVLVLSVHRGRPHHVAIVEGDLDENRFHPRATRLMDPGPSFYAPHAFTTRQGDPLVLGWLRDPSTSMSPSWVGAISLPRRLDVDEEGRLVQVSAALDQRAAPLTGRRPVRPAPEAVVDLPGPWARLELEVATGSDTISIEVGWTGGLPDGGPITFTARRPTGDSGGTAEVRDQSLVVTVLLDSPVVELSTSLGEVASILLAWPATPSGRVRLTIHGDPVRLDGARPHTASAQQREAIDVRAGDGHG